MIWQGRNRAIHWEEGNPRPAVRRCFDMIAIEYGPRFGGYADRNLAADVVDLLGWADVAAFRADLLTLA